jgi:hypothetical protein
MKTQQEACSAEGQLCRSLNSDPNRFAAVSSRCHGAVTTLSTAVAALDAIFRVRRRRNRASAVQDAGTAASQAGLAQRRHGKDPANGSRIPHNFLDSPRAMPEHRRRLSIYNQAANSAVAVRLR